MIYSYALDTPKETVEGAGRLDEYLSSLNAPARETWGRLPSQQKAMARAADMARRGGG